MQDQDYINYLKEEVARHVSLCVKGEMMEKGGWLRNELSNYRRHISFMMNGLKKLGVSEEEREQLINPIKEN